MLKNLLEFHHNGGYIICVQQVDDGINVTFPPRIIYTNNNNILTLVYMLEYETIKKYVTDSTVLSEPNILVVPNYLRRIAVCEDLLLQCLNVGINSSLLLAFNAEGENVGNDVMAILPPPDESELVREEAIKDILISVLAGEECGTIAVENNVGDGYKILLNIFQNGGF